MSDGAFSDWMTTDSWSDYRQARRIRELDTELSSLNSSLSRQRADSSRLRSQLAHLQGSLEERINRMSRSFDAFVELSDIRTVLALFDAPALVRHRSRQLLANIAEPADMPATRFLPREADVPDYWLSPAVRGLSTLLDNGDADADIAAAEQLDPVKTATLIAATAALAGRLDVATTWLGRALGDLHPGVPLTVAQRLLWHEAAAGAFGQAGAELLEDRLRTCLAEMDDAKLAAIDDGLHAQLATTAGLGGIALFDADANVQAATAAARQLSALRKLCETAPTLGASASVAPAPDGTADPSSPSSPSSSSSTSGPMSAGDRGKAALGALVRQIVDEGTDEERPMLRRAEELKAVIENRTPPEQPEQWDALTDTPEALLVADASGIAARTTSAGAAADPGAAASAGGATASGTLARRVMSPRLIAIAADLVDTATVDPPDAITLSQRSGNIRITKAGPNAGDLSNAQRKVENEHPPILVLDPPTWVVGAIGLVLAVLSFFLPVGWLILLLIVGAGGLIWAGARYVQRRRMQAAQTELRQRAVADVERRAGQSHQNYLAAVEALQVSASRAAEDNQAIKRH